MKEIWKDIKGYEGAYQISNLGRVKTLRRKIKHPRHGEYLRPEKILRPRINHHGYLRVAFNVNKVTKDFFVHRLIAIAFIPNPHNYATINHMDGNKLNNDISNLEWCTQPENLSHAHRIGLCDKKGILHHNVKLTEKKVLRIRKLYAEGKLNQYELADKYDVSVPTICNITKNNTWRHI